MIRGWSRDANVSLTLRYIHTPSPSRYSLSFSLSLSLSLSLYSYTEPALKPPNVTAGCGSVAVSVFRVQSYFEHRG